MESLRDPVLTMNYINTKVPLDSDEFLHWPIEYQERRLSVRHYVYLTLCMADLFAVMTKAFQRQGIPMGRTMTIEKVAHPDRIVRFLKKTEPQFIDAAALNGHIPESVVRHPVVDVELDSFRFVSEPLTWWNGVYWLLVGYADEQESGFEGGLLIYYGPERYRI